MKHSVLFFFLLACMLSLRAQQSAPGIRDCSARLNNAEDSYQAGLYDVCITILEEALDSCTFSRKEKEQALELLAKSYVETGEQEKAESTVNLLLINYPHYELRESENPELYNRMVRKYRIHPKFTIGAKNTADWLRHKTIKVYSVLEGLDYSEPIHDESYFFTYYAVAEYEFIEGLSINMDFMFFWSRFNRNFFEEPSFNLSYWEDDRFMEFPFYLKKYFHAGKNFLPYVSAGIGFFINYEAFGNVTLSYTEDDIITGTGSEFSGEMYDINMLEMRNKVTGQWNAGAGIGYTIKNLRFFIDVRYLGCLGSFTAPEKSDLNPVLKYEYFYIDQAMKINQFEIGVTISYTLFNSVKRIRK